MSGGIIIQRRAVLVPAAIDSSIYNSLPDHCKSRVDAIVAKAPGDTTAEDIETLAALIHVAVHS